MKICALLIPKEMKVAHSTGVKDWTDAELEDAIVVLKDMMAAQASKAAKLIDGIGPAALPAPEGQSIGAGLESKRQRRPNRLMMQADTAVGPRERKPRMRRVPSPLGE
jgi:hypothetical protein